MVNIIQDFYIETTKGVVGEDGIILDRYYVIKVGISDWCVEEDGDVSGEDVIYEVIIDRVKGIATYDGIVKPIKLAYEEDDLFNQIIPMVVWFV